MFRPQRVTQERVRATHHDFPAECVQEQLARILNSETFAKAESLRRLLNYLVERSLFDDSSVLKEYVVGVEVFDRGERFDPAIDTIVRVQARRLRAKLRQYYASEGLRDSVVVELPKGQYAALFRLASAADHGGTPVLIHTHDRKPLESVLPISCMPLIGRETEVEAVTRLLRCEDVRLLTLTGAGGSGKTRLALQAATEVKESFKGGVVVRTLGPRNTDGLDVLNEFGNTAIRGPTLLILDGFEQVLEAAPLLVSIIEACAHWKVLITSRAPLYVSGEHKYVVPPLATPDSKAALHELSGSPAVRLFVQRAAAEAADFTLSKANGSAVAEICRRLDGLPLAIELAAARIRVLSPAAMLPYLDRPLELLTGGPRNLPLRQQSLRSSIDWSHDLLDAPERTLFRRLSVFVGGFTLESAAAVCNAVGDLEGRLLDILCSLVDKSLVQRTEQHGLHFRFAMPAAVREYGHECLANSGEIEFIQSAHAAYYMVLAEETTGPLNRRDRAEWLARCDSERANFSAALDWLLISGRREWAVRLAALLFPLWKRTDQAPESCRTFRLASALARI